MNPNRTFERINRTVNDPQRFNGGHVEWRPMPSIPGYLVSSVGLIARENGEEITQSTNRDGYKLVCIYDCLEGRKRHLSVHRLVCAAFNGPCPKGKPMVAHLDGSKDNNTPDNLRWVDAKENASHMVAHGTVLKGEAHPRSILTTDKVREIWTSSDSARVVGKRLGVSRDLVKAVRHGDTWRHITDELNPGNWPKPYTLVTIPREELYGDTLANIASRFGVSETTVERRRREDRKGDSKCK